MVDGVCKSRRVAICWVVLVILSAHTGYGFLLFGSNRHTYSQGEVIYAKVNSLTSINSLLSFSYYTLPYCKPPFGIEETERNLGQLLAGDRILTSPYRFQMNVNGSFYLCTTPPLTKREVEVLNKRINDFYQVNLVLDDLPAARYISPSSGLEVKKIGFPVGYRPLDSIENFIINHLKFRVLIREHEVNRVEIIGSPGEDVVGVISAADKTYGYEIVGFEIVPCTVKSFPEELSMLRMKDKVTPVFCPADGFGATIVKEQERISFSYEVEFVKTDVRWESRWDAYLDTRGTDFHWFSVLNSFILVLILAGILFFKIVRIVTKDLATYNKSDREAPMIEKPPEWRLLNGDVFREPKNVKLLCVMVGNGIQIIGTAIIIVVFSALGLISPACQGMLLTWMLCCYMFLGIEAAYTAVRLWRFIKGTSDGWKSVSLSVAFFFPGIVFLILAAMNFIHWESNSSAYIPISSYITIWAIWFNMFPLTLFGGFLGTIDENQNSVHVNKIPREAPRRKFVARLSLLVSGYIPFSVIHIELFYILSDIFFGRYYNSYGCLLVNIILLVITCGIVSILCTFNSLRAGNWKWWWQAFFAPGLAAVCMYLYVINYLITDLRGLNGPESIVLYLGYSLIVAIAILLSTCSIGLLVSIYFVHTLYKTL